MKKTLIFAAVAALMAICITSCNQPVPITYPENLVGYWDGATGNPEQWYGIDVVDAQNASLITYYANEESESQQMAITYDATTGKGKLIGDGRIYNIKATSDSTFTINMVEGTVVFYRGVRPAKTISMTGYWQSDVVDYYRMDMLAFPKDKKGKIYLTLVTIDVDFGDQYAAMATLEDFDATTGVAKIATAVDTTLIILNQQEEPLSFIYHDYTLVKQPKANNMPKSLQGIWRNESFKELATISISVKEDNDCTIDYRTIDKKGQIKSGTVKSDVYYCPAAGMGTVVPHDLQDHPELAQLIGANACGVFQVASATEINVTFMGMSIKFVKQ